MVRGPPGVVVVVAGTFARRVLGAVRRGRGVGVLCGVRMTGTVGVPGEEAGGADGPHARPQQGYRQSPGPESDAPGAVGEQPPQPGAGGGADLDHGSDAVLEPDGFRGGAAVDGQAGRAGEHPDEGGGEVDGGADGEPATGPGQQE